MITSLNGIIRDIAPPVVEIDVNGVGYGVELPMTSICQLPAVGEKVLIFTHLIIREDAHQLFGFINRRDRSLFKELIKINGIGPKSALTILSSLSVEEMLGIVRANDVMSLTKIPGVGKKTAERLMIELKKKKKKWSIEQNVQAASPAASSASAGADSEKGRKDQELAVQAMVDMGYNRKQSETLVKQVYRPELTLAQLISEALKATFGGK